MQSDLPELTAILKRLADGDDAAGAELASALYNEFRSAARRQLGRQAAEHTLQPTAVVHEVFMKVCGPGQVAWNDRRHFFAIASRAMRQVLINYARAKATKKRGDGKEPGVLMEDVGAPERPPLDVLVIHSALEELAAIDERKHRIVELRFFTGLSVDEIAELLEVSKSTVENEWRAARAWLSVRLG